MQLFTHFTTDGRDTDFSTGRLWALVEATRAATTARAAHLRCAMTAVRRRVRVRRYANQLCKTCAHEHYFPPSYRINRILAELPYLSCMIDYLLQYFLSP